MSKFTQFIGIDISKEYFDASILISNSPVKHDQFTNTKRGVTQFLKWIKAEGCSVHSSQFTVYSLQFTVYSLQFTVHSLQFTVHGLRITIYESRITIHQKTYLYCINSNLMHYQEILPVPALRAHIRYFWVLESGAEQEGLRQFKILPDGIPALIYQDIPNFFRDTQQQTTPQLYIYGPFTTYTDQWVEGTFRIIGAYLEPTALKTLFKLDASDLVNQTIPIDDLVDTPLLERLQQAQSTAEKVELLAAFILQQIQTVDYENKQAKFASILLQRGQSLGEIQSQMNISERTLERLVKQHIGMSPKVFSRIMRFQTSLDRLKTTSFDRLTTLVYDQDYFDQSHFIREFKIFTGNNPTQFLCHSKEELANFPEWKKEND